MSYEQKLMQMKKQLKKSSSIDSVGLTTTVKKPPSPSYERRWLASGLLKEENKYGIVYKRIIEYPLNYVHGEIELSGLKTSIMKWHLSKEDHPLSPEPTKPIMFFDTETTGLKGTGTFIFLMGFIEETEKCFRLTQYLLPGPDHEAAFLYATRLWETPFTIVSYNGKSFDIPQVETRWILNRKTLPPLLTHDHIDLLHGSRRIWKGEMDRFKLPMIEQQQLGFFREGDIPGFMAPIIYQDAVKNGDPELLMKILFHNEWDILSLVALYIRATNLLLKDESGHSAISQTNIGKWFADLKSYKRSKHILENTVDKYGNQHPITFLHLGFIYKKEKDFQNAVEVFSVAVNHLEGKERIIAYEELAKLYEHRLLQLHNALNATRNGRACILEATELTERFKSRSEISFKKREMRLLKKIFPGETQKPT